MYTVGIFVFGGYENNDYLYIGEWWNGYNYKFIQVVSAKQL